MKLAKPSLDIARHNTIENKAFRATMKGIYYRSGLPCPKKYMDA